MKQQEIIKKIGVIINELQEQYQYIEKTKGVINDLELELFVANGNFLSDHVEILRKINSQLAKAQSEKKLSPIREKFFEPVVQPAPAPPVAKKEAPAEYATFELSDEPIEQLKEPEPAEPEPVKEEPIAVAEPVIEEPVKEEPVVVEWTKPEPVIEETPVVEEPVFKYEEPIIRHELVVDQEPDVNDEETETPGFDDMETPDEVYVYHEEPTHHFTVPEFTPTEIEPVANFEEQKPETPAYAASEPESYRSWTPPVEAEKPPTVYEKISGNFTAPRLSDNLPPIMDIKSAINLNDKMLYVRELFHGYSLSYSEAIEILNRCTSFDEADQFLKTNYATKNDWEDKPATVEKFYGVLRRRFA